MSVDAESDAQSDASQDESMADDGSDDQSQDETKDDDESDDQSQDESKDDGESDDESQDDTIYDVEKVTFKDYISNLIRPATLCTISRENKNFVIRNGKRLIRYLPYLNASNINVAGLETTGIFIQGNVRFNQRTTVDVLASKQVDSSEFKSKIKRHHITTLEDAIDDITDKKWYILGYKYDPFAMQLQASSNLAEANFYVVLRLKSGYIDCRFSIDRTFIDNMHEYEQLKCFVVAYDLYSLIYDNTTKYFTEHTFAYYYECFEEEGITVTSNQTADNAMLLIIRDI